MLFNSPEYLALFATAMAVGWSLLRHPRLNHSCEVVGGVMADECATLLREFFAKRR